MAPRKSKRKEILRNPIPVWLPLPRSCLRNLHVPGPPYYVPISPGMYLPPWALPPLYYTKPICHCAHEDFCTTSTCKNSNECVKMQPIFCPHGVKHDGTSELPRNVRENIENSDDDEISSDSDMNICSTCGGNKAPHNDQSRLSDTKNKFRQKNQTKPSKLLPTQDSFTSSHNLEPQRNDNNYNGCGNSCCERSLSHLSARENNLKPSRNYKMSTGSTSDYAENTESSLDKNVSIPSDTFKKPKIDTNAEFGCSSCIEPTNGHALNDLSSTHNSMPKANVSKTKNLKSDTVHVDQLPEQLSKARQNKANKKSGCCLSGSESTCKMRTLAVDEKTRPITDINNITDSSKRSECGSCSAQKPDNTALTATTMDKDENTRPIIAQKPDQRALKTHQISDCRCSCSKISSKESSRFRNASKCDCSSINLAHMPTSRSHKMTDCECFCKRVSQYECCRKLSRNTYSSSQLLSKKSSKSATNVLSNSKTDITGPICECKFPPVYEHLSCKRNSDNCNCTNNK